MKRERTTLAAEQVLNFPKSSVTWEFFLNMFKEYYGYSETLDRRSFNVVFFLDKDCNYQLDLSGQCVEKFVFEHGKMTTLQVVEFRLLVQTVRMERKCEYSGLFELIPEHGVLKWPSGSGKLNSVQGPVKGMLEVIEAEAQVAKYFCEAVREMFIIPFRDELGVD
jgi:hypothetical protein